MNVMIYDAYNVNDRSYTLCELNVAIEKKTLIVDLPKL